MLAAGLDGVRRELRPGPGRFVTGDPAALSEADRRQRGIHPLPRSLDEAIHALENDELLTDALGSELAQSFIAVRRSEWEAFKDNLVTPNMGHILGSIDCTTNRGFEMSNGQSIRTDNVGSILRPPDLLEARQARAEGRLTREQLTAVEDQAILGVLDLQRSIGMDVVTDGEYRRDSWLTGIQDAVDGFVENRIEWRNGKARVVGSSRCPGGWLAQDCRKRAVYAHEAAFLAAHATDPWKITTPSATQFAGTSYMEGVTTPFYPTRERPAGGRSPGSSAMRFGHWWMTASAMFRSTLQATLDTPTPHNASGGCKRVKI